METQRVGKRKRQRSPEEESDRDSSNSEREEESLSSSDETDDSSSQSDDDLSSSEEMLVDFAGHPPGEADFHGIKRLLQQLLLNEDVDTSGLTDIILEQPGVSVCLKVEGGDEDGVFGILSPISFGLHKDVLGVKQLSKLLVEKASAVSSPAHGELRKALEQPLTACVLINERMVNVPPQVAGPLHQSLQADLKECIRQKEPFDFAHFIILCKSFTVSSTPASIGTRKKPRQDSQAASSSHDQLDNELQFVNVEDEIFAKRCRCSFSYPIQNDFEALSSGSDVQSFRTVLLLSRQQMRQAWQELEHLLL